MRLLVLGGTRFVGRALVAEALSRNHDVVALNRGTTPLPDGARLLQADRTDVGQLEQVLAGEQFDAVVDTWAGAPSVARDAARLVRADRKAYVSSVSVYAWGQHADECSPLTTDADGYAADKLGGERAWGDDAVHLRAGMVLGPHEDVGRLPWWLDRCSRGGRVVAPGRPDRPLQYVDARDLAAFGLDLLERDARGPVDVVSRSGHATTRTLLEACVQVTGGGAQLVWVGEEALGEAQPWTQLPCWVPEAGEHAGFMESDVSRALELGLVCRPVEETVADTWAWLQREGVPPQRPDRPAHGLPEELERALLSGA